MSSKSRREGGVGAGRVQAELVAHLERERHL